jgi:hypothetical protein
VVKVRISQVGPVRLRVIQSISVLNFSSLHPHHVFCYLLLSVVLEKCLMNICIIVPLYALTSWFIARTGGLLLR